MTTLIHYTLDRKSIRNRNAVILDKNTEENINTNDDQHYLELVKLIENIITEKI